MSGGDVRFQPPGCEIWVVLTKDGPPAGRFRYDRDAQGRPCNPELIVGSAVSRAEAFRLALEHETRWKWILEAHEEDLHRRADELQREQEAASRWDEIQRQWKERQRRAQETKAQETRAQQSRASRPAPTPVRAAAAPQCIELLGLAWPCTEDEVRRAYRELAKRYHPDRGGSQQQFIQLREAFESALRLLGSG